MTISPTERVCPYCGRPAGQQPFCAGCGINLSTRDRLPTRAEWDADHPDTADLALEPVQLSEAEPRADPVAHGPEFIAPEPVGRQSPPIFQAPPALTMADFASGTNPQPLLWDRWPMAAWGYRVGATLTNVALAVLAGVAAYAVAKAVHASDDGAISVAGLTVLGVWLVNALIIAAVTNGQSLGKKLAGIRVVRENGRRYGIGTALVRDVLCRVIYIVPLVWLIDLLIPLGEQRQTLRDRMVSTRVMQEPVYRSRRWPLAATAVILTASWFALVSGTDAFDTTENYTPLDRELFISGCSEEGTLSEGECGCVFDEISARLPYDQYAAADRQDPEDWSPRVNRSMADGITSCTS